MKRLLLLDGHALLFRAFHAMPAFTTPDGRPSGAVYGFSNVVLRMLRELEPTWVIGCFDAPGPTFRDEVYKEYKATRAETPAEVISQEPMVKEVLDALAIPHYALSGFEADDLIATLVHQALNLFNLITPSGCNSLNLELHPEGVNVEEVVIATGDRDLLQLADERVKIYLLRRGIKDIELVDGEKVRELIGLPPAQLLDWKALRGDPSDNIIGVPGVGDKTALQLVRDFGSLEKLYAEIRDQRSQIRIKDSLRDKLLEYQDRAFQNRELLKLRTDVPIELDLKQAARSDYDPVKARALLASFGFKGILGRLPEAQAVSQQARLL